VAVELRAQVAGSIRGDGGERTALVKPVAEVGTGDVVASSVFQVKRPRGHDPVRLGVFERPQQDRVDDRKNRRRCANPECKRDDGTEGETGRFGELAEREFHRGKWAV
jgi:hypothetical protein